MGQHHPAVLGSPLQDGWVTRPSQALILDAYYINLQLVGLGQIQEGSQNASIEIFVGEEANQHSIATKGYACT